MMQSSYTQSLYRGVHVLLLFVCNLIHCNNESKGPRLSHCFTPLFVLNYSDLCRGICTFALTILYFYFSICKANIIAGIMNYLLRAKQLSRTTKFILYKSVIRPTALCGCETWVLNQVTREIVKRW